MQELWKTYTDRTYLAKLDVRKNDKFKRTAARPGLQWAEIKEDDWGRSSGKPIRTGRTGPNAT